MHTDYIHRHTHAIQVSSDSICLLKSALDLAVPTAPASEGTESTHSAVHTQPRSMIRTVTAAKCAPTHPSAPGTGFSNRWLQ